MIQPIGHDINGRPLRVGDEVELVGLQFDTAYEGMICVVAGRRYDYPDAVALEGHQRGAFCQRLRKLTDDHRPADESFSEMMERYKQPSVSNNKVLHNSPLGE